MLGDLILRDVKTLLRSVVGDEICGLQFYGNSRGEEGFTEYSGGELDG